MDKATDKEIAEFMGHLKERADLPDLWYKEIREHVELLVVKAKRDVWQAHANSPTWATGEIVARAEGHVKALDTRIEYLQERVGTKPAGEE